MTSLSLYVLTAFNQREVRSAEAALKYFLFGGLSAAVALFGFSLVYGLTGTLHLVAMGPMLAERAGDPLLWTAIVAVVTGFGFKIAAVPFHLWAPDAYQGAPTPSAALIATGSKVASFFILARFLWLGLPEAAGSAAWNQLSSGWALLLALLATASMVFGNLAALVQKSVKRLLAYSAIAHAGYMLLAVLAGGDNGMSSLLYYVIVYGAATLGAFTVVSAVEARTGGDGFEHMTGLSRREPLLAFCMMVFLLSLAGIPPLAGFFGKFYIFVAAAEAGPPSLGLLWLVIVAIATSVISLYYYLMVLKQVYVVEATNSTERRKPDLVIVVTASVLGLFVLGAGCFPSAVLGLIRATTGAGH
jgi:NADH-quinone oxidoreductase subunit N